MKKSFIILTLSLITSATYFASNGQAAGCTHQEAYETLNKWYQETIFSDAVFEKRLASYQNKHKAVLSSKKAELANEEKRRALLMTRILGEFQTNLVNYFQVYAPSCRLSSKTVLTGEALEKNSIMIDMAKSFAVGGVISSVVAVGWGAWAVLGAGPLALAWSGVSAIALGAVTGGWGLVAALAVGGASGLGALWYFSSGNAKKDYKKYVKFVQNKFIENQSKILKNIMTYQ